MAIRAAQSETQWLREGLGPRSLPSFGNSVAIEIRGTEHETVQDALVELNFSGDRAISISGRVFTVNQSEYRRLQDLGLQPTTWHHDEEIEEILSVPGRH